MGGHRTQDSSLILGRGKRSTKIRRNLGKKIGGAAAVGVATAAVKVIAMANPAVAVLYAVYELAKFTYPIAEAGVKEYAKSQNSDKAVEKMVEKTGEQVVDKVKEKAVEVIVNTAWAGTKETLGTKANEVIDEAVTTAVSTTISELVKHE